MSENVTEPVALVAAGDADATASLLAEAQSALEPASSGLQDGPPDGKTGKPERPGKVGAGRMLLWQSNSIAVGCNVLVLGFLSIYATDTLKVPAALVGTLLLVAKVADAITALLFGYIVDKTNTRWGRARPYQWCIVGLWLCTWLMFSASPEWELAAKAAWILVMYIMVTAVFMTFLNASGPVYLVRAFPRSEQHLAIQSYGSIVPMLFAVAFNISFPIAMGQLATSASGWSALLGIYALPLVAIGLLRFFTIKETVDADVTTGEKLHLKDVMLALRSNGAVFVLGILLLVFNLVTNMGVGVYYFTHIVHNVGLMGAVAAIQIVAIPLAFVFPSFVRRFSIRTLITVGLAVTAAGYLLAFFALDNFAIIAVSQILVGAGNVPLSMLSMLMILECADYNEWKGIPRMEGTISGLTSFATMLGAALGSGIMGWLLGMSGYTGDAATMPDSSIFMIRLLFSLIPMALYLVLIVVLRFYKLTDILPRIRQENADRRAAAEAAQGVGA